MSSRLDPQAKIAITVHDDFQGRRLGTFLVRLLMKIARGNGIKTFTADLLSGSKGMLAVLRKVTQKLESRIEDGVCRLRFDVAANPPVPSARTTGTAKLK